MKTNLTVILFLAFAILSSELAMSQGIESDSSRYPYVLPIWGQKAQDRGFADQLQLPFGFNVNYVNAFMDLEITEFGLTLGGQDLSSIINTETLNFTSVNATTNGLNYRADAWVLPFMNVYALLSTVTGGTDVSLQPTWKNSVGETILQLPEFSSSVEFDALAYGVGTTFIFGWEGYFLSTDVNISRTDTELLKDQVGYLTLSARVGHRFFLNKNNRDLFVAPYCGIMYRNFIGAKGNNGSINLDEVFPGLQESFDTRVEDKVTMNQEEIDMLSSNPIANADEIAKLKAENLALNQIKSKVDESGVFSTEIDYFIRKELIQTITFQFGFNLQINKHWMLRGEYGVSDSQRFLMTGIQYRFGVKKRS
ncbi:hypothetical protein N6H18_12225 [Reichenbachiella agarivorans]|uniref:Outer membrane protein beta-barrel domain-containing protein n=1 Tax=Reichenbachiella agarivorans TaxID=2979464 RepID=A0ABY6CKR3_9BACT|nr:hypothetical protein [Reichenbachiella agarivorans]UXP31116.1 hypothetical protein N6H18_12225 [Reichenbachiella agarivorans]